MLLTERLALGKGPGLWAQLRSPSYASCIRQLLGLLARYAVNCMDGRDPREAPQELFLRKVTADQLHPLDASEFDPAAPLALGDMVTEAPGAQRRVLELF